METNRDRRKYKKYAKRLSYVFAFLFMVTFRQITDKPDSKGTDSHTCQQESAVIINYYFMPDNELCQSLIAELKTSNPDFQVSHLID